MATITVKNIPDELYERLKQLAEANRRSINSEVIVGIERAVGAPRFDPHEFFAEARRLRERVASYVIRTRGLTKQSGPAGYDCGRYQSDRVSGHTR